MVKLGRENLYFSQIFLASKTILIPNIKSYDSHFPESQHSQSDIHERQEVGARGGGTCKVQEYYYLGILLFIYRVVV